MTQDELDTLLVGDDPQPSINLAAPELGSRALKRVALDDLMARAMSGLLPRNRELKSWEPDLIDERHMQAIIMRSAGLQQGTIAEMCGWTESWTSVVLNHPDAQYILTKMVSYAADEVLDVAVRIKGYAGEALDKVVEVMRTGDNKLASANAFELLRMGGYGAVEKKQVEARVVMAQEHSDLLAMAIRESKEIHAVEGKDYRVVIDSVPERVGSVAPATPAASGRSGAGQPPNSGARVTEILPDDKREVA